MNWTDKINGFGKELLGAMGYDLRDLQYSDHNPISKGLESPGFVERFSHIKGFNRTQLSRLATVCQMMVYDEQNGPEMDGREASLREQWYRWYKVKFAQPLAIQLGDKMELNELGVMDIDGRAWFGRMSQTYGWIVANCDVTYKQMWVEDSSRKMDRFYTELFRNANIIVALEKDGMVKRFTAMSKALGARSIYSGKGKSSRAAIELLLRNHFGWNERHNPFSTENPLVVIYVSDYDYDGEAVIGPTFAKQIRRYTPHVLEARVGIGPAQVKEAGYEWPDTWYLVKIKNNKGYINWTHGKGLFWAKCQDCGHLWPVLSSEQHDCPQCAGLSGEIELGIVDVTCGHCDYSWRGKSSDYSLDSIKYRQCPECAGKDAFQVGASPTAYGFEVEALYTKDYTPLLVDAYLSVVPFQYVVGKLRDECQADSTAAAEKIRSDILADNKSYQALLEKLKEFDRMNEVKANFEQHILDELDELGAELIDDWRDNGDDPTPEDYKRYVGDTYNYGPWRPFDQQDRTDKLIEHLEKEEAKIITAFEKQVLEWTE